MKPSVLDLIHENPDMDVTEFSIMCGDLGYSKEEIRSAVFHYVKG